MKILNVLILFTIVLLHLIAIENFRNLETFRKEHDEGSDRVAYISCSSFTIS